MLYPEAKIALCKCKEGQRAFGVRFEEYENEWNMGICNKKRWYSPERKI